MPKAGRSAPRCGPAGRSSPPGHSPEPRRRASNRPRRSGTAVKPPGSPEPGPRAGRRPYDGNARVGRIRSPSRRTDHQEAEPRHPHPGCDLGERAVHLRHSDPSPGESAVRPRPDDLFPQCPQRRDQRRQQDQAPPGPGAILGIHRYASAIGTANAAVSNDSSTERAIHGIGPRYRAVKRRLTEKNAAPKRNPTSTADHTRLPARATRAIATAGNATGQSAGAGKAATSSRPATVDSGAAKARRRIVAARRRGAPVPA